MQRHKEDQRSEKSTTGLRSRISEGPRAFAGSALSECHFLVSVFFFLVKIVFENMMNCLRPSLILAVTLLVKGRACPGNPKAAETVGEIWTFSFVGWGVANTWW